MDGKRESENVIDAAGGARRSGGKKAAMGGGIIGIVLVAIVTLMTGGDFSKVMSMISTQATSGGASASGGSTVRDKTEAEDEMLTFVKQVLADTEDTWNRIFAELGKEYEEPTLVSFADKINTACNPQTSAVGPFYCGGDKTVYIDLTFFSELAKRFGARGDFAQAYVLAHEVGHHVQFILGISGAVAEAKSKERSEVGRNRLSVRQELHADFLAGVWAFHAQKQRLLEPGDLEEALRAAQQIGDDTLQRNAGQRVQSDGFTHGTAKQRQRWFELGYNTGDMKLGMQLYELDYDEL